VKKEHKILVIGGLTVIAFLLVMSIVLLTSPSPFRAVVEQEKPSDTVCERANKLIDVNSADIGELMTLPNMTKETAVSIMEYRETYRRFRHADELLKVRGVDERLLEAWEPYIRCK